jgi:hypothetical protein
VLRLLSAPSVRFWKQTAICPVSLWALVVELHPLNWARAQAVRRISDKVTTCTLKIQGFVLEGEEVTRDLMWKLLKWQICSVRRVLLLHWYQKFLKRMFILFYPEDLGSRFIRNDVTYLKLYTASYPRINLRDEKITRGEMWLVDSSKFHDDGQIKETGRTCSTHREVN